VVVQIDELTIGGGRLYLAYAIWPDQASVDAGDPPCYRNDHLIDLSRLQARSTQQPIRNADGSWALAAGGSLDDATFQQRCRDFPLGLYPTNPFLEIAVETITETPRQRLIAIVREHVAPQLQTLRYRRQDSRAPGFAPAGRVALGGALQTAIGSLVGSKVTA
jgi:hypothetical protein